MVGSMHHGSLLVHCCFGSLEVDMGAVVAVVLFLVVMCALGLVLEAME